MSFREKKNFLSTYTKGDKKWYEEIAVENGLCVNEKFERKEIFLT